MARSHLAALEGAERVGFGLYIVSAPTPFSQGDTVTLKEDAGSVIMRYFPDAKRLYDKKGWRLPNSIGRIYDGSKIERELGFTYETRFADLLDALREGAALPITDDESYVSPVLNA